MLKNAQVGAQGSRRRRGVGAQTFCAAGSAGIPPSCSFSISFFSFYVQCYLSFLSLRSFFPLDACVSFVFGRCIWYGAEVVVAQQGEVLEEPLENEALCVGFLSHRSSLVALLENVIQ